MKVTVCQIDPRQGAIEPMLVALGAHVASERSDFLLLPEMCFSEWLAADPVPDGGRWAKAVAEHEYCIARLGRLGARAAMGTRPVLTASGSRRNEAYLWDSETGAAVGLHQKYYLPDEEGYWEHRWYDRGPKSFDLGRALGMRIGVQICTEMWFFEWARHYAASRADLLCIPRATPHGSTEKWLAGGRAAAVSAGAYCLSSNLWCPPGEAANCGGLGWIIDPEGEVLARTDVRTPFATATIDLAFSRASKTSYPRYVPE